MVDTAVRPSPQRAGRAPARRCSRRPQRVPIVFVVPMVLFLAVFVGYPMVQLVRMSVSEVNPATILGHWPFVGLRNFTTLYHDPDFAATVRRTVVFGAVVLVVGLLGGMVAALALQKKSKLASVTYATMVLVWSLPAIVNGATWKYMLNAGGTINQLLSLMHLGPVYFLVDGNMPLLSVAFVAGRVSVPFATIVFRSALLEIPVEYFEAAQVDGASRAQQFRYITFPHIASTVYVVSILLLSYAVRSFDFTYTITSGGPGEASTTLPFLGYLSAFTEFNYSGGAAIAVITIIAVLLFALPYARGTKSNNA